MGISLIWLWVWGDGGETQREKETVWELGLVLFSRVEVQLKRRLYWLIGPCLGWTPFGWIGFYVQTWGHLEEEGVCCFPASERLEFTTVSRGSGTMFSGPPGRVPLSHFFLNLSFIPFLFSFLLILVWYEPVCYFFYGIYPSGQEMGKFKTS